MLRDHGGASPTRQIGRDSSASWRVLDGAGFLPPDFPSFDELARNADAGLFRSICSNPDHVLRHYFTDKRHTGHTLPPRAHSFALYLLKTPGTLFLGPFMEPC